MDIRITKINDDLFSVENCGDIDLDATFHCGQAFRFSEKDGEGGFSAVVKNRLIRVWKGESGEIFVAGKGVSEDAEYYVDYLDLRLDYGAIKKILSADENLSKAVIFAPGIHILRQDPWEALGSFIFSSNNNITRISGMISRFCELFGEPAQGGGYSFPSPERVASLNKTDLAPLRCGYRDEYILDAARRVAAGEIDLDAIAENNIEFGRTELMKIKGVGPKVAECVLLFGFHKLEAFPIDVHMKRVMAEQYPEGLPAFALPYAGIAQQYLFHRQRMG